MSGPEQMAGFSRLNEITFLTLNWGFPGGSVVKNPPAMQETWVQSLLWEDPLEKEMQTTPLLLPGESHGQKSLVGYSPWTCKESDKTEQ